jgi:hypothetical protein
MSAGHLEGADNHADYCAEGGNAARVCWTWRSNPGDDDCAYSPADENVGGRFGANGNPESNGELNGACMTFQRPAAPSVAYSQHLLVPACVLPLCTVNNEPTTWF